MNEAAKYRYRSGGIFNVGGLTIRAPCSAVGHGGHYHSQTPEAYFAHCPGIKVNIIQHSFHDWKLFLRTVLSTTDCHASQPYTSKGIAASFYSRPQPCYFPWAKNSLPCCWSVISLVLDPFYDNFLTACHNLVEEVPVSDYELPLGKAEILKPGKDVTVVGYGSQIYALENAIQMAEKRIPGLSCELIDVRSIVPLDIDTIAESVNRTGRLVIAHEAPKTGGFAAEIASAVMERCFLRLEAPIQRVCGWDTPFPLAFEKFYMPDMVRCFDAIKKVTEY